MEFYGKPTNVNNTETYASIPWIIENGGQAFMAHGVKIQVGQKYFQYRDMLKNREL